MKLVMFDDRKIKLPKYKTFQERLNFVNNYIFSKNKYKEYYGYIDNNINGLSDINSEKMSDRWLGVRREGSSSINNHVKNVLNLLGVYLISADNLSIDKNKTRYIKLRKKFKNNNLSDEELQEFYDLDKYVLICKIYPPKVNKEHIIFMINPDVENIFYENNYKRYLECQNLKEKTQEKIDKVEKLKKRNKSINKYLNRNYKQLKKTKENKQKNTIFNRIKTYIEEIELNNKDIEFLEEQILDLSKKYKFLTEYK